MTRPIDGYRLVLLLVPFAQEKTGSGSPGGVRAGSGIRHYRRPLLRVSAVGLLARVVAHCDALEACGAQHLEDVVEEDHRLRGARREFRVSDLDGGHAARVRDRLGVEPLRQQPVCLLQVGGEPNAQVTALLPAPVGVR